MNITCIGAGYVGLVTASCLADMGNTVICLDIDQDKIDKINNKISPIYEEKLDGILKKNKLTATTSYKKAISNADIVFICVGTPEDIHGSQDLSYIEDAIKQMAKYLKNNVVIVIKSSVVPSTTEKTIIPMLEKFTEKKEGIDFFVAVNPEFLQEGTAVYNFLNPDRLIIGCSHDFCKKILFELYKDFTCPKIVTDLTTAEMIKYASNACLATRISFINELGNLCKQLGIDSYQVTEGVGLDPRIGKLFLRSGIGWGGSCFPKDVKALISLAKKLDEQPSILESVLSVNDNQPLKIINLLKKHLPTLSGKTIGILGGAFKNNTDDIRESRAIPIISELIKQKAKIRLYDPKAMDNLKKLYPDITYCCADDVLLSDAVLIVTEWSEFEELDYSGKIVIDGRRVNKAKKDAKIYEGICW